MKIVNREIGGGKTTALVEIMLRPGNEDVIFVAPAESQAMNAYYHIALGVFHEKPSRALRDRFISAAGLRARKKQKQRGRYVIDELEGVIGFLVKGTVLAVSGTDEDYKFAHRTRLNGGAV